MIAALSSISTGHSQRRPSRVRTGIMVSRRSMRVRTSVNGLAPRNIAVAASHRISGGRVLSLRRSISPRDFFLWRCMNFGDAMRILRGLGLVQQFCTLDVRSQHEIDQLARPARRLLLNAPHFRAPRQGDRTALGGDFARNQPEQRRLARAVAPDETNARALGQLRARAVEQDARAEAVGEVGDDGHWDAT